MSSTQQAVALREQKIANVGSYLDRLAPAMSKVLPKHLNAERMARIALVVVRKDPKLADCIPESFAGSLLTAAALGLEPGVNGECYLVPYNGECTLIVGYQGLAKLFWQHPMAKHLDAQSVHEKDEFDYAYGLEPFLTHKPAKGDRGPIVAYYAVAALSSGAKAFVVLTPEECHALRGRTGPGGKIADPMHWMERKTALRQLFKLLPKSPSLQRALDADDRPGTELHQQLAAQAPAALPTAPPLVETEDAGVVNSGTGEVVDAVLEPEEPNEPAWPDTAPVPA
jgi:recombination protein RecT